ncbi:cytokinin riboside 5'-monophosphate phosphoribohydrolase LOG1-like [Iris pallida]|uniref:Cytokinin riboside 5'-monophosphate phosphoribohydrolase LOG1-like n=1 Tax=Iris pallida TaxID=29817 RepID=A0AAX6ESA2_IRIPA|nr:cytokinin riboside 5'-monophosphate phosphoribohydrolase LOG1-like [Iris pallida]KAJ6842577.1 cytokinin riboside 5'-monophosphate phosphoribohydrolase LOG1-like [Iris pallida]
MRRRRRRRPTGCGAYRGSRRWGSGTTPAMLRSGRGRPSSTSSLKRKKGKRRSHCFYGSTEVVEDCSPN